MNWLTSVTITLIGIVLSIISFAITLSKNAFGLMPEDVDPILASFFISIIILLTTERCASLADVYEQKKRQKRYEDIILNTFTLKKLGPPSKGKQYINSRKSDIKRAINTHCNFDKEKETAETRFYNQPAYAEFKDTIIYILNNGAEWFDIVSEDSLHHVEELMEFKRKNPQKRYFLKKERVNAARLNFILLYYNSGEKELLLGWDYMSGVSDPEVWATSEEEAVGLFEKYFDIMWHADAEQFDLATADTPDDIRSLRAVEFFQRKHRKDFSRRSATKSRNRQNDNLHYEKQF